MIKLADPSLVDVLQNFKTDIFRGMNCVKIGEIFSFDEDEQTAQVQISFKRVLPDGTIKSHPVLLDCPVFTPQGGGGSLSFPIEKGDECLVLFSDRNIDNWMQKGGEEAPADARAHSLSDGIVLVGLNSLVNSLDSYAANEVKLSYGTAVVGEKNNLVTVKNGVTSLLILMQNFVTVIEGLQVTGPLSLTPASVAALEAFKATLSTLLY
jgi:hypothetical protein